MKDQLDQIKKKFQEEMAKVKDMKELDRVRVQFLGKKGAMTQFMKGMGKLSKEERLVSNVAVAPCLLKIFIVQLSAFFEK